VAAVRILLLTFAIALMGSPAVARIPELPVGFVFPDAQQAAVAAVLDEAGKPSDPIESAVLAGLRRSYEARHFNLWWLGGRQATPQMTALRGVMDHAADYGLDPAAYPTPILSSAYPDDPAQLAEADVEFSRSVARFITHLASGRINPTDVSKLITIEPERPDIDTAFLGLAQSTDIATDVASFEPPHPEYQALKAALARLRTAPAQELVRIAAGKTV
jgi:murein L,D-transpeptidase YcbB/YkuD